MDALDVIWHGLRDSVLMAWEVWWALVFGFAISGIVQAWVPRERIERALSGSGPRPVALATSLGAASSSCSYAAVAIAKSLLQKGASATTALAFQFASTNLVWELGLVLWVLIGWQFALAEYLGGLVMIALMALLVRVFVSPRLETAARAHAQDADTGHQHNMAGAQLGWRERLTSASAWSDVAHNFRADWQMLWKEITIGFVLAGFVAQLGNGFFDSLFLAHTGGVLGAVENVIVGPIIAMLSFVCSVGNVPLAAVLWSGGISFAGVLAFIFADLIVLPIVAIYRKYYGTRFALRITALMFVTMVLAALILDGAFSALGLIPTGTRPSRGAIFGSIAVDYKLFLNLLGLGGLRGAAVADEAPWRERSGVRHEGRPSQGAASGARRGELLLLLGALPARLRARRAYAGGSRPQRALRGPSATPVRAERAASRLRWLGLGGWTGVRLHLSELAQPALDQAPLGVVVDQLERASVRALRLRLAPHPPEHLRAGGVQVVIGVEVQALDDRERGRGTVELGDGDRAAEFDDGGARHSREALVELRDAIPRPRLLGVQRGDRGLQQIRALAVQRDAAVELAPSALDQRAIPQRAVLVVQQHQLAVAKASWSARQQQRHHRQQTVHLGLVWHQFAERATKSNRLVSEIVAPGIARVEDQVDDG